MSEITTDFDSKRWTFKKSGTLSYSLTLGPAFIHQAKDEKHILEQIDESAKLFNERKIGVLKHLGQLFSLLIKSNDPNVIETRVKALKSEGKNVRVLDLMGYGSVIRKLDVGGLAVALDDIRNTEEKEFDEERHVGFVKGDIKSSETWHEIEEDVNKNGPYDLVLCRPLGGKVNIPERGILYSALINKMYSVTNPNGGTILTEFHRGMTDNVGRFVGNLKATGVKGIQSRSALSAFCLTRSLDSPNSLPVESFK